jgi:hypothetical protein
MELGRAGKAKPFLTSGGIAAKALLYFPHAEESEVEHHKSWSDPDELRSGA